MTTNAHKQIGKLVVKEIIEHIKSKQNNNGGLTFPLRKQDDTSKKNNMKISK